MEILLPSPLIYPHSTGGMELFNHHLACEAARRGHEVHLISRKPFPCAGKLRFHRLMTRNQRIDAVQIIAYGLLHPRLQILHVGYASNSYLVYATNHLCRWRRLPYVVNIHGGGMHPWTDQAASRRFFANANAVMAVSRRLQKGYTQRLERSVEYIPPIIPFVMPAASREYLRAKLGFESSVFVFLIVGSIKEIKGSDFMIRTILSMGKEALARDRLRFVFLGDGPLRRPLEQEVTEAGLQQHVIFKGLVPHERVGPYFKAADAFLIPSKFEGTPVALLEALFHGLPVVGSDTEGIADIIDDAMTGFLFKPFDASALVEKIQLLIHDPRLRTCFGQAGRRLFEAEYSFDRVMDRHLSILQAAAEANR